MRESQAIKTVILPFENWSLVEREMRDEFNNAMPVSPEQSTFLTALDGEKLAGFLNLETIFHYNCLYVSPEYKRLNVAYRLVREADALVASLARGYSAIALAESPAVESMLKRMGMRLIGERQVFRKDYP